MKYACAAQGYHRLLAAIMLSRQSSKRVGFTKLSFRQTMLGPLSLWAAVLRLALQINTYVTFTAAAGTPSRTG